MKKTLAPYFIERGQTPKKPAKEQLNLLDCFSQDPLDLPPEFIEATDPLAVQTLQAHNLFALDIETYSYTPLGALLFLTGGVRLVTVAFKDGTVVWWDSFRHAVSGPFFELLKSKIKEGAYVVGHNLKFDMGFLMYHYGFVFRNVYDTMLASQVLWSGVGISKAKAGEDRSVRCRLSHSLGALAERLLGTRMDKTLQRSDWGRPNLTSEQLKYACLDAAKTLQCWFKIAPRLKEEGLRYSGLCEFMALPGFAMMEVEGIPVDTATLTNHLTIYKTKLKDVEERIREFLPSGTSHSSNSQLLKFFNGCLPRLKEPLTSVDREVLLGLSKSHPEYASFIEDLLAYRFMANLIERLELVRTLTFNGRVHTTFRQIAAAGTGRSSCTGKISASDHPSKLEFGTNSQTIPNLDKYWEKKVPKPREVFKAPPGYKIIIYDLSQAHNRIACEMSQDQRLISIYRNDEDAHALLGYEIAKMDGWQISFEEFVAAVKRAKNKSNDPNDLKAKRKRDEGKVGNYSQLNQGGVKTVQSNMQAQGIFVTEEQVRNIQKSWRKLYKTLYRFILGAVERANQQNFAFHNIDKSLLGEKYGCIRGLTGRRQYLLKEFENEVNFTDSISYMWLSAEADMVKEATGLIYLKFIDTPEWGASLFNMSHDEINAMVREEYAVEAAAFIVATFESVLKKWIRSIPVGEKAPIESFICNSLADK